MSNSSGKITASISAIGLLGYLLYFVGRRYIEGYYNALGLPSSGLRFETTDYLYQSIQLLLLITIIVVLAFGIKISRLIPFFFTRPVNREAIPHSIHNKDKRGIYYAFFIFAGYFTALILFGFSYTMGFVNQNSAAFALVSLILTIAAGGAGLIAVFDKKFMDFVLQSFRIKQIFITLSVLGIIFFPYFGSYGWGAYKGFLDIAPTRISQVFPTVELSSNYQLSTSLNWQKSSDNVYHTTDKLYLLLENNEMLYIRPMENESVPIAIPINALISFTITPPSDYGFPLETPNAQE